MEQCGEALWKLRRIECDNTRAHASFEALGTKRGDLIGIDDGSVAQTQYGNRLSVNESAPFLGQTSVMVKE